MTVEKNRLVLKIGGEAGYGIMSAGQAFAKLCTRAGLFAYTHTEYPSLVRGGHNVFAIRVEEKDIKCPIVQVNLLVALNKQTIEKHKDELTHAGGIIYDGEEVNIDELNIRPDIKLFNVPLLKIVQEAKGIKVMRNSVSLGAAMAVLDADFKLLKESITSAKKKSQKVATIMEQNIKVAKEGYDYIKNNYPEEFQVKLVPVLKQPKRMLLTGNTALSLGAIKAGCQFHAQYPMTPSSSILHYLVSKEHEFNMVVKHAEDEISAINMAIGAGFSGVRSMTATSGGGLALMTESVSLAGSSETPIVIVNCQRPGPGTGLPTRQGQEDLKFVLNIGHGEFPKVVVAPGDTTECFYETFNAFNLADKYQLPVLIVSDKHLASCNETIEPFDTKDLKIDRGLLLSNEEAKKQEDYRRYKVTESGISPRAIPGQKNCRFRASSDEHDEFGDIEESIQNRVDQMDKRMRKMDLVLKDIPVPKVYGPKKADVTIVSWGSTKQAILEAMEYLKVDGITANFLQMMYIHPFHSAFVKEFLESSQKVVLIEGNKTAQLGGIIRENTSFEIKHQILKYDGRTFFPSTIYDQIKEIHKNG
jgi:2-oxoglutarate/2-oxoacid ferredoxin oxidoreductase subunit alpha